MARRGITTCKFCGKKIRFVKRKDGTCLPVASKAVYITPKPDCSDTYYRANGTIIKGLPDPDGFACYTPHHCQEYERRS